MIKPDSKALTDVRQWREEVTVELANQTLDERNRRASEIAKRLGLRVLEPADLARPSPDANRSAG
ncbi:MAG: hypothetical protein IT450_14415 [Phycisphaerales bacterium]|nr:hypothetical protein [Phycisphaerales bacterium]